MGGNRQGEEGAAESEPVRHGWLGISCVVDRMPEAVVQLGVNGIVEAASQAVDAIFGWDPDDLVGQPITVLMGAPEGAGSLTLKGLVWTALDWQGR